MRAEIQDLPAERGAPVLQRLNQVLETADFDGYVERQSQRSFATLKS